MVKATVALMLVMADGAGAETVMATAGDGGNGDRDDSGCDDHGAGVMLLAPRRREVMR